jgi:hypothetical protein
VRSTAFSGRGEGRHLSRQSRQIGFRFRGPGAPPSCSALTTLGNVLSGLGAGAGVALAVSVAGGLFGSATLVTATGVAFLVITLTAAGRLPTLGRRAGFFGAANFGALAFLLLEARATVFFLVAFPAARAVELTRAFDRAAAFVRLFAAFGALAFRASAGLAVTLVSSSVNRSLSCFISFRRRASAVVTSRIASFPSVMRA